METHSGLFRWLNSEESACNAGDAGDLGSNAESGKSLGRGHGHRLQYSCLENPGQRSLMGYSPWGRKASDTTKEIELACRHGNELIDSPLCSSSINTLAAGRVPRAPGFVTRAGPPCWFQLWAGPAGGRTFSPCSRFNLLARAARLQGARLGWAGGGGGPDQPERRSPLQLAGHQNPRKLLPCGASPPPVSFTLD